MSKTKSKIERRMVEMRAVDDEEMVIEGYAIVFEQPATHEYYSRKFTEVIKKGALDESDMRDVPMRYNHKDSFIIMARTRNDSLQLIVDDHGLKVRASLIDIQGNVDLYKAIQNRLIDKMSFAFTVADGGDTWTFKDDETFREIKNINKLYDVSVVDTPFYDGTDIYARSFDLLDSEKKQLDSKRAKEVEILKTKILIEGGK